jgi:hypothetical protein
LANEIVYIDTERITDKPILKVSEIQGSSNFFESNFKGAIDKNDIYINEPQIFPQLQLIDYLPKGTYITGATIPNYRFIFNYNIQKISNENIKIYKNDSLFQTLTDADLIISNEFIDATIDATTNGNYKIVIPANKFKNEFNSLLPLTEITFKIKNADYNKLSYNSNNYLTD